MVSISDLRCSKWPTLKSHLNRRIDNWTMGSHIKENSDVEHNFGGRSVFPVWQMLQDDELEDDEVFEECDAESVGRLTGNVRACYLNHLEKIVIKNYETCSNRDRSEWPFTKADLIKCAAWMEYKALRSCMVVILYQRAMTRLVADIKRHTEELKIYTKLKHFMSFDTGWSTKTTQTCDVQFVDQETQTDLEREVDLHTDYNGCYFQDHSSHFRLEEENMYCDYLEPSDINTANCVTECAVDEPMQGVPIPVYVSGITSSGIKTRNTHNVRVIKNIEPAMSFSEIEKVPIVNGIEPLSNQTSSVTNGIENELYAWSLIEGQTDPSSNPHDRGKSSSRVQETELLSNGVFNVTREGKTCKAERSEPLSNMNIVQETRKLNENESLSNGMFSINIVEETHKAKESELSNDMFTMNRAEKIRKLEENEPLSNGMFSMNIVEETYKAKESELSNVMFTMNIVETRKSEETALSNGMFSMNKVEETRKMTVDERLASMFGIDSPEFSDDDEDLQSIASMEQDEEPSVWTMQKCEQDELLRAKVLDRCVVDVKRRGRLRLRILELFDSDSDDCFEIDEQITNYRDKLAHWVVVSLMPYYRDGRIQSRPLFKIVARHIADNILSTNRWTSESDVMQNVVKFFNYHNKIESEDDIWTN